RRDLTAQAIDDAQPDHGDSNELDIADRFHRFSWYSSSPLLDEPAHGGGRLADASRSRWRALVARLTLSNRSRRRKDRSKPRRAQNSEFNSAQQDRSRRQGQIAAVDPMLLGAIAG